MNNKTFKIKDVLNNKKNIQISLNQTYDSVDVLSLKINTINSYPLPNANYGYVVGRITADDGYGIPNAKVCIFIPKDINDSELIKEYYPFESPYDKKSGVRYNLLSKEKQHQNHTPVGTFYNKEEILNNTVFLEIYEKYYKYTTKTNYAGDYLICGVPTGQKNIHLDIDLSDIDIISIRPYDLINNGLSASQYTTYLKFRQNLLENSPQIFSVNDIIDVIPFWGNSTTETNNLVEIGLTRFDYNIPTVITPHAVIIGNIFTDKNNQVIKKNCSVTPNLGHNCKLEPINAQIQILSKNEASFKYESADVDTDGNFIIFVPMEFDKITTNELGEIISNEINGIPTKAKIRMKISSYEVKYSFFRGVSQTASYLIPNLYNRFEFDSTTHDDDFFELEWKKVYTVSNYIPRYQKDAFLQANSESNRFLGIKSIGTCDNVNNFPYNRVDVDISPLYLIIRLITGVIKTIANVVKVIPFVNNLNLECNDKIYDGSHDLPYSDWQECVLTTFAENNGMVKYQFYNEWFNGGLYFPKFQHRVKYRNGVIYKDRFCDYNCREIDNLSINDIRYGNECQQSYIVDSPDFNNGNEININMGNHSHGIIKKYEDNYYYSSRWDNNTTDLTVNEKTNLLLATNFVEIGVIEQNSYYPDLKEYFNNITASTYQETDKEDTFFNTNGFGIGNIHANGIILNSQVGVNYLTNDDDIRFVGNFNNLPDNGYNTNANKNSLLVFDRIDTDLRKYLCENNKYYKRCFAYTKYKIDETSGTYIINNDGTTEEITTDVCKDCNNNEINRPYYFYFGLNNNNALNKFKKNV